MKNKQNVLDDINDQLLKQRNIDLYIYMNGKFAGFSEELLKITKNLQELNDRLGEIDREHENKKEATCK